MPFVHEKAGQRKSWCEKYNKAIQSVGRAVAGDVWDGAARFRQSAHLAGQELNNHRLKPVGLSYGLKVRIRVA